MNKKVGVIGSLIAGAILTTGCHETNGNGNVGDKNTTSDITKVNKAPVLVDAVNEIKFQTIEGTTFTLNLDQYEGKFSDPDGDELKYNIDLPENSGITYSIDEEGNITFTVPLVDVTEEFSGTITAEDPEGLKSEPLTFILKSIDRAEDAPLTFSDITINNTTISPDGILEGTTNISDDDGIESVVFKINGIEIFNEGTNTSFKLNVGNLELDQGNYELEIIATGKNKPDSENYNSGPKSLTTNFTLEYVDGTTTIGVPELVSKTDTTITLNPGDFEDVDGVQNVVVVAYLNGGEINTSETGEFTNLEALTEYEFVMRGKAFNKQTGAWETKEGNRISLITEETPNTAPVATDGSVDGEHKSSKTFSMADVISDNEDLDEDLTIIVTQQPVYTDTDISTGIVTINGLNATFEMSEGNSGTSEFKFKVIDSQGLESDERIYILSKFDNG